MSKVSDPILIENVPKEIRDQWGLFTFEIWTEKSNRAIKTSVWGFSWKHAEKRIKRSSGVTRIKYLSFEAMPEKAAS